MLALPRERLQAGKLRGLGVWFAVCKPPSLVSSCLLIPGLQQGSFAISSAPRPHSPRVGCHTSLITVGAAPGSMYNIVDDREYQNKTHELSL